MARAEEWESPQGQELAQPLTLQGQPRVAQGSPKAARRALVDTADELGGCSREEISLAKQQGNRDVGTWASCSFSWIIRDFTQETPSQTKRKGPYLCTLPVHLCSAWVGTAAAPWLSTSVP